MQDYTGIVTVELTENELANFYENNYLNYKFLNNQYILIKHNNEIIDKYRYFNGDYIKIIKKKINSKYFGTVKAKDCYQQCLIDALLNNYNDNNNIVLIKGKPGSGKTLFSLSYAFYALENALIDKIIIVANCLVAKNSAKLGYYPGSRNEKILDSFLGNMLISKLGDKEKVYELMNENKLDLLPIGDIRGYETKNKMILYIPEAQNFDINLMKLTLQRTGEGTKIIIDGDLESQVDLESFEGINNGMRRVSEVFRGEDIYTEVTLKNIYRSKIAAIADRM